MAPHSIEVDADMLERGSAHVGDTARAALSD